MSEAVEGVVCVGLVLVGVAWLGGGSGPVAKCEEGGGGLLPLLVVVVMVVGGGRGGSDRG